LHRGPLEWHQMPTKYHDLPSSTNLLVGGDTPTAYFHFLESRQTEIQTAEPFVPEPSISEVEVAIGKLKRCKLPGADQMPAELTQVGGTLHSEIHKLIKLI
jgi:hypothetical protein